MAADGKAADAITAAAVELQEKKAISFWQDLISISKGVNGGGTGNWGNQMGNFFSRTIAFYAEENSEVRM